MKAALVILILLAGIGASGYFYAQSQGYSFSDIQIPSPPVIPDSQPAKENGVPSPTQTSQMVSDEETGTITGSLSFPSEGIPDALEICAVNTDTDEEQCTDARLAGPEYTYGVGYELVVPAGDYYVYAYVPGQETKAYYSDFVVCGLSVDCESHDPIEVSVTAGAIVSEVDPGDWYAGVQPSL